MTIGGKPVGLPSYCRFYSVKIHRGVFERIEPVEIFHQFPFLSGIQFDNISFRKLVGIIFDSLIDISRLNSIQTGNISVQCSFRPTSSNHRARN